MASSSKFGAIDGSTEIANRTSRPMALLNALTTNGRSRVSKTSLVNSLGAATKAVSSTKAKGRVKETKALCWGVKASSLKSPIALAHSSVKSTVSSTKPPNIHKVIHKMWRFRLYEAKKHSNLPCLWTIPVGWLI